MKAVCSLPPLPPLARKGICLVALGFGLSTGLAPAADAKTIEARGTIQSVDAGAHTLVVLGRKDHAEHKFRWDAQTKFTERGRTATSADLKEGARARVTYTQAGDTPTLQRVRIVPAKAAQVGGPKSQHARSKG